MIAAIAGWDLAVEGTLAAGRPPLLIELFSWITALGDARVITVVALATALILLRHRLWSYKAGFAVALFGSMTVTYILKLIVARGRPLPPLPVMDVAGYSFPSMHAAVSLAVYGFLAYMVFKLLHPPHRRLPWALVLMLVPLLIGFSRVYLGVHFTSDVLAGWAVGALFLYVGIRLTKRYS